MYEVIAYWPNAVVDPLREYRAHFADALDRAIKLRQSYEHTTISVRTPDCLELVRLWGQPMPDGKDWP